MRIVAKELLKIAKELTAGFSQINSGRDSYLPIFNRSLEKFFEDKTLGIEVWKYNIGGKLCGIAFGGKSKKPVWRYRFVDMRDLEKSTQQLVDGYKTWKNMVLEQREERKNFQHSLKVGDILYASWGYDQTNIDFYQVVGVLDKSVKIREIDKKIQNTVSNGYMVVPDRNKFIGPILTRRVSTKDSVKVDSVRYASLWDGKPKYETDSMFGH